MNETRAASSIAGNSPLYWNENAGSALVRRHGEPGLARAVEDRSAGAARSRSSNGVSRSIPWRLGQRLDHPGEGGFSAESGQTATAPARRLRPSGIEHRRVGACCVPSPSQTGHQPSGLLNEKWCGDSSSKLRPHRSQARAGCSGRRAIPLPGRLVDPGYEDNPLPRSRAVSTEPAIRDRAGSAAIRSTTISRRVSGGGRSAARLRGET